VRQTRVKCKATLYDPANKDEAIAILKKSVPKMSDQVASASYAILLNPQTGFSKDAALNEKGIAKVLELRSQYGEPRKSLTDPAKYYDLRYYENANAR
jgi:hypothetical protein